MRPVRIDDVQVSKNSTYYMTRVFPPKEAKVSRFHLNQS